MANERNLAVHGVRYARDPEPQVYAIISRGPERYESQALNTKRINNLIDAARYTISYIQLGIMIKNGLVSSDVVHPLPDILPPLLTPDYDPQLEGRE